MSTDMKLHFPSSLIQWAGGKWQQNNEESLLKKDVESDSDLYLEMLNYRMATIKHELTPSCIFLNRKLNRRMAIYIYIIRHPRQNNYVYV